MVIEEEKSGERWKWKTYQCRQAKRRDGSYKADDTFLMFFHADLSISFLMLVLPPPPMPSPSAVLTFQQLLLWMSERKKKDLAPFFTTQAFQLTPRESERKNIHPIQIKICVWHDKWWEEELWRHTLTTALSHTQFSGANSSFPLRRAWHEKKRIHKATATESGGKW